MSAASYTTFDWYETPRYYDIVFDVDTRREADFLEAAYARHATRPPGARAKRPRRALEPACGSGRLVAELARRGWSVSGSDLSATMLAHARARLREARLPARLALADMSDFRVRERADLAHCLVSTFKYLLSERAARAHLACVARALRPGGIYVLGFHLTDYAERRRTRERWVAERDGTKVVCNIQGWPADRARRTEEVRSRLVVHEGRSERRSETVWRFRTYDAAEVRALLASVPALEHVATYDFTYDFAAARELDDSQLDLLLVLRKRRGR
jgi:SAM-dependent methyltransferase